MRDCIFCRIVRGEEPAYFVYEDEKIAVFLDKYPVFRGHMLVVPREHYETILQTPDTILQEAIRVAKRMAEVALGALGADGVRIVQNNGEAAGQVIHHFHIHVIPFYSSWRHHSGRRPLSEQEAREVVKAIRGYLESP